MNKEIERKYAIKYIPDNMKIEKIMNIKQSYIYRDILTVIRVRKITNVDNNSKPTNKYVYTLKTQCENESNSDSKFAQKYEVENDISEDEYSKLLSGKISNTINKTRVVALIPNSLKVEIDIYHEYLDGLVTLEVEFSNEEEANKFIKPDWFGEEIGYKELSNGKLSGMKREEFESKVTEEFIQSNKKVIKELMDKNGIKF